MLELSPKRVLMVDDEIMLRRVLKRILGTLSFPIEATEAEDGSEAIDHLKEKSFDLILLDVKMPIKDGFETLEWIRSNDETKELPVMMLTAESEPEDIYKGRDTGATFYLTKPFDTEDVKSLLEAFFQGELV